MVFNLKCHPISTPMVTHELIVSKSMGEINSAKINGTAVNCNGWSMIDNPCIHQGYGGTTLTLTGGKSASTYDFKNWTIGEGRKEH